ncbi:MAG: putative transport system ATP-binding protein [Actinomycetota bacterium]|nr:putative transport system ATP-binding protein [Actinomycetota bacterium]
MTLGRPDVLIARGVVKSYRTEAEVVHALVDVDVTVHDGEFLAVTGPSGSGKTTLLNCLSGLDTIDAGSVVLDGVDLAAADDALRTEQRASTMGFVFQTANLLPDFTALENVTLPMVLAGTAPKEARRAAVAALERVGVGHRLRHYPSQLSGGEQQRVAIARAFAKRPRIVWADEPTGNLDMHTADQVIDLLRELHADGTTLILVTHDVGLAAQADRGIEVRDGRVGTDPSNRV